MKNKEISHIAYINFTDQPIAILVEEKTHLKQLFPEKIKNYRPISSGFHNISVINRLTNGVIVIKRVNLRPGASYMFAISKKSKDESAFKCILSEERNMSFKDIYYAARFGNFAKEIHSVALCTEIDPPILLKNSYTNVSSYSILDPAKKYYLEIIDLEHQTIRLALPKSKKFRIYTLFIRYDDAQKTYKLLSNIDRTSYVGNNLSVLSNTKNSSKKLAKTKEKIPRKSKI